MGEQKPWLIWRMLRALLIACGAIFVVLIAAVVIVGVSTDHDTKVAGSAPPVSAPDPASPAPASPDPAISVAAKPTPVAAPQRPASSAAALGGKTDGLAKAFNDKAEALHAGVRIAKKDCRTELRMACTYTLTDGVSIVAGSAPDKKTLQSLTVLLQSSNDMVVMRYLAAVMVFLRMYAPDASGDEAGVVTTTMMSQIADNRASALELHGVKLEATVLPEIGIATNISRGQ